MGNVLYKTAFYKSNKAVDIRMDEPTVLTAEQGHPIQRLKGKDIPAILERLREFKLPSEQGPFADTKSGDIKQVAWDMKKKLRGSTRGVSPEDRLEQEIKWAIDVMIPRMMIFEDGPKIVPIQDMFSHPLLNIVMNFHELASRDSDDVMSAGRLVSARRAEIFQKEYLLINHAEERVAIAVAIMQANEREAYPVSLVRPDLSIRDGVAVFPDQETMLTFSFFDTHPQTAAMLLLSDHAMMSMLALRSAENIKRKILTTLPEMIGNGETGINEYVRSNIRLVRERVKLASTYWEDNSLLDSYIEELRHMENTGPAPEEPKKPVTMHKGPDNTPKDMILSNNLCALVDNLENQVMDRGGVARKVKGIFRDRFTKGMHPEEVVKVMEDILGKLAQGFEKYGYDSLPLLTACKYIGNVLNDQLPGRGLDVEYVARLNDHAMPMIRKINAAQSKE